MIVIHKSWCGACKKFAPRFASSEEILELSKEFVMINCQDDEEPNDEKFRPDGSYIPRIFFMKPNGDIIYGAQSGYPGYKYYFTDAKTVIQGMEYALAHAD